MRTIRNVRPMIVCLITLLFTLPVRARPVYAGPDEHQPASVEIALHRGDLKGWAPKSEEVRAYCFFHAANIAHVDGHWYAVNGIARTGLNRHWVEDGGLREKLEDGDKAPGALRDFLYAVNDKINDACP